MSYTEKQVAEAVAFWQQIARERLEEMDRLNSKVFTLQKELGQIENSTPAEHLEMREALRRVRGVPHQEPHMNRKAIEFYNRAKHFRTLAYEHKAKAEELYAIAAAEDRTDPQADAMMKIADSLNAEADRLYAAGAEL